MMFRHKSIGRVNQTLQNRVNTNRTVQYGKTQITNLFRSTQQKHVQRKNIYTRVVKGEMKNLPIDIVLVRHGESEGNLAKKYAKNGDNSHFTPEFAKRHTSEYRLTDRGREQARIAGEWIKKNISPDFDGYYTSEYVRARETAAMLDLPDALWFVDFYLRERDKGVLVGKSPDERVAKYPDFIEHLDSSPLYARPPGGESIAETCLRVDWIVSLWKHLKGEKLIAVCHGNIMMAFRLRLERLSVQHYLQIENSDHPFDKINNGQILHYTRRNPTTGEIEDVPGWVRSVCPWDMSRSRNEWEVIRRPFYSNQKLLEDIAKIPQLVNNGNGDKHSKD